MDRRLTLLCLVAAQAACDSKTGGADSSDTGSYLYEFEDCTPVDGDWPLASGQYTSTTDEALYNNCQNAAGNGYRIGVGAETPLDITADRNCVTMLADGMLLAGEITDTQLRMIGYLDDEFGICTIRIDATFMATITADNTFEYQVDAVAAPHYGTDEYCEMMIGDSQYATFPQLPCDYGWRGTAWLP